MENRVKALLTGELEALKQRIIDNHIAAGQVASGKTMRSLQVTVTENGGLLTGRPYFGVLETGRKAGKVPRNFRDIILQWVRDKGIQVENEKSFAYLVARKIRREGTSLYRKGGRADIYSNEIPKTIQSILDKTVAIFAVEVETININSNENNNQG